MSNQFLVQIMQRMDELTEQVTELRRENQELRLHLVAIHPAYTDEQRKSAMEQIVKMQNPETLASKFK